MLKKKTSTSFGIKMTLVGLDRKFTENIYYTKIIALRE